SDYMKNTNLVSMVAVMMEMGKTTQVSQYLAKRFKEVEKEFYMVEVAEVEKYLNEQIILKLTYKEQAKELLESKKYLEFTDEISVKTTGKKKAEKKGTIKNLRKFLELKGLNDEFQAMLNNGELETEEAGE
ncbi:MAG: hypothetical protein ACRCZ0_12305, partial [Cetobacterium sp.]